MFERIVESCEKKKKYWVLDFSFYVYAFSHVFSKKCECGKDPSCKCKGTGVIHLQSSTGVVTSALYGIMKKVIDKMNEGWTIVMSFDPPTKDLFRTQLLDSYKAQRGEKEDHIVSQMKIGKELFCMIPTIECYISDHGESDDVIARKCIEYALAGHEVVCDSRDKDMHPILAVDGVTIFKDNEYVTKDIFIERWGFPPERFNEYLSLAGDTVDNFPGIKGIGDVAAKEILSMTDHVFDIWDDKTWKKLPEKYRKKLVDENGNKRKDLLKLMLQLATLDYKVDHRQCNVKTDKSVFKNLVETLELRIALNNINLLFPES